MRKRLEIWASFLLVLLTCAAFAWGMAAGVDARNFHSNGESKNGWYWLRARGHYATWTFSLAHLKDAKPGTMYLNMHALVTNGNEDGSGFDTNIKVKVQGKTTETMNIPLINPFKPKDSVDSKGLGCICYGSSTFPIPDNLWRNQDKITLTILYPFPNDRHEFGE